MIENEKDYELKSKLYIKIYKIMNECEYLQKDDLVSFGGQNYMALSEEKVTGIVRPLMMKNKLILIPIDHDINTRHPQVGEKKQSIITEVKSTYLLCDAETGYSIKVCSFGQGADTQDKGSGKANTYSFKYLLIRLFMIVSGEDPDKIHSARIDAAQEISEVMAKKEQANKEVTSNEDLAKKLRSLMKERKIGTDVMLTLFEKFQVKTLDDLPVEVLEKSINKLEGKTQ